MSAGGEKVEEVDNILVEHEDAAFTEAALEKNPVFTIRGMDVDVA